MILIIDNYDSFTYNLYQFIAQRLDDVQVVRNDKITIDEMKKLKPKGIVLSPGQVNQRMAVFAWSSLRCSWVRCLYLACVLGIKLLQLHLVGTSYMLRKLFMAKKLCFSQPLWHLQRCALAF